MNWLIKQIKGLFSADAKPAEVNIHEQDTEETTPAPESELCPTDEELAKMRMPELREHAAHRNLTAPRRATRAELTELIKQSY